MQFQAFHWLNWPRETGDALSLTCMPSLWLFLPGIYKFTTDEVMKKKIPSQSNGSIKQVSIDQTVLLSD